MPWPCKLVRRIDEPFFDGKSDWSAYLVDDAGTKFTFESAPIGTMWMSGPILNVKLPGEKGGITFSPDRPSTDTGKPWLRVGTPPKVSVHPSINIVGLYHGWITDGIVLDDCEGRTFDDTGAPVARP